jgi:hypothetical protein
VGNKRIKSKKKKNFFLRGLMKKEEKKNFFKVKNKITGKKIKKMKKNEIIRGKTKEDQEDQSKGLYKKTKKRIITK